MEVCKAFIISIMSDPNFRFFEITISHFVLLLPTILRSSWYKCGFQEAYDGLVGFETVVDHRNLVFSFLRKLWTYLEFFIEALCAVLWCTLRTKKVYCRARFYVVFLYIYCSCIHFHTFCILLILGYGIFKIHIPYALHIIYYYMCYHQDVHLWFTLREYYFGIFPIWRSWKCEIN